MGSVYLDERGTILGEITEGAVVWDNLTHIDVFGVANTIPNGNPDFGKRKPSPPR